MAKNQVVTKWVAQTDEYNRKTKQARDQLDKFGKQGKQTGQVLGQLDKVMGTSIGTLSKMSLAAGATATAMKVLKDAFFNSETNVDNWGRTVESAKAVYDGFLDALNHGSFSSFFDTIDDIVKAATKAYNALDELKTMGGVVSNMQSKIQAQMTQQKEIIRKKGKDSPEGKAAQARLQELELQMKDEYAKMARLNKDTWVSNVKAKAAGRLQLTNEMWRAFYDDDALNAIRARAKGSAASVTAKQNDYNLDADLIMQKKDTRNAEQMYLDLFTDKFREEKVNPYFRAEYSAMNASYGTGLANTRYTGGKSGGGKSGGKTEEPWQQLSLSTFEGINTNLPTIADTKNSISYWTKQYENAGDDAGRLFAEKMIKSRTDTLEFLQNGTKLNIDKIDVSKSLKELPELGNETEEAWKSAASSIASLGSAMQGIEDPAVKVMGIIAEAIANVALAASSAMKAKDTTASGWAWIGAAAGITGTMISTIAAIKSATEYHAQGGVVGKGRGTDSINTWLTPGEVVLNHAQQANVAAGLTKNNLTNLQLETRVSGRDLRVILNNDTQSRGMGKFQIG